jgi:hypothetical protein
VASHEVGDGDVRPAGIDEETLAWWIAAHRALWRRRFELNATTTYPGPVQHVELRKTRRREPSL